MTGEIYLKTFHESYHALALVGIRETSTHGAQIVSHVRRVGGAGDNRRHPLIGEQYLRKN